MQWVPVLDSERNLLGKSEVSIWEQYILYNKQLCHPAISP
jgi:hypothetical protein